MKTEKKIRGVFFRDGAWWIQYYDSDGRRRREKVGTKANAEHLVQKRRIGRIEGQKLPERKKAVLFSELADDALEYSKAHKLSYGDDVIRMKGLRAYFGHRPAETVTPQEIERWLSSHEEWKPATSNRYRALLSLAYKRGIRNRKVTVNPARLAEKRREDNARDRYLLDGEEIRLRAAIRDRCPERMPEIDVALNTGMRRGEQYGCEWTWINFDRRQLTIPRAKNGERRHVYLNDTALAVLQSLRAYSDGTGKVFGHLYRSADSTGPREWFESCLKDAKIANFRWHDLRHTFASRLTMAGVDLRSVQEAMGHKTIAMTCRYAHLAPQHQLEAVQRLCEPTATPTATGHDGVVGYIQ